MPYMHQYYQTINSLSNEISIWFGTKILGWFILHIFWGHRVEFPNQCVHVLQSLKIVNIFANRTDPDEFSHSAGF